MIITIGGVDQTAKVVLRTFRIDQVLTREADTAKFSLLDPISLPALMSEVIITDASSKRIFAGVVLNIVLKYDGLSAVYDVTCKDYTELIDGKYVVEDYTAQTVSYILNDINTKYLPAGFTIDCQVNQTISYVKFNYEKPSQCLAKLAELVLGDWYVDYNKSIKFINQSTFASPFPITDNNNKLVKNSLTVRQDASQIKNTIFVRGGEYVGNAQTQNEVADGVMKSFSTNFKFSSKPTVTSASASYAFKKKITITGQAGAGTNYQIPILVGESSGAVGANVHTEGKANLFPSAKNISGDLRFKASDGTTDLPFWVESVTGTTPNRVAKIWVKVLADLGTNQDIYLFYKGASTNVSDPTNTFILFDDFDGSAVDATKWNIVDATGISVTGGIMTETGGAGRITSKATFSSGVEQIVKFKASSKTTGGIMPIGFFGSTANGFGLLYHPGVNSRYYRIDTTWLGLNGVELPDNVDYLASIKTFASTVSMTLKNYSDLSMAQDYGTITNTVSAEPIGLGKRYDDSAVSGGSMSWDFIFIKKVQATEPAFASVTAEQTMTATALTVGVDNIDTTGYDCYWNFEQKYVRFDVAPVATTPISMTGTPYVPVYVKAEELGSIGKYGVKEFKIIDSNIKSKQGAVDRAKAELQSYNETLNDGNFQTYETGLRTGQVINISSTILGITDDFVINRLAIVAESASLLRYDVTLTTLENFDLVQLLQQLLDRTEIGEQKTDEVLEKLYNVYETVNIGESITVNTPNTLNETMTVGENIRRDPFDVQFVLTPYTVIDENDPKRPFCLDASLLS